MERFNDYLLNSVKASWDGDTARKIKSALNGYLKEHKQVTNQMLDKYKALDTLTSYEGLELVDTILMRGIINKIDEFGQVAPYFPQIVMPSGTYQIPVEISQAIVTMQAENTGSTGQVTASSTTPRTYKAELVAKKFTAETWVSRELEEDSVIGILNFIIESHNIFIRKFQSVFYCDP